MAQNDILKRYLDAGMAFTQLTRERAEAIVGDLVKAGEVRRKETEQQIEALLERSRKNTEDLVAIIRREVAEQLKSLGLEDLAKRAGASAAAAKETGKETLEGRAPATTPPAPPANAPVKKAAPAKAAKKAAPAKKASPLIVPGQPAKKAPAKKLIVAGGPTKAAAPKKAAPAKKSAKKSPPA
jgi:polyhydroxyalkanoate synthesis regulator phasin